MGTCLGLGAGALGCWSFGLYLPLLLHCSSGSWSAAVAVDLWQPSHRMRSGSASTCVFGCVPLPSLMIALRDSLNLQSSDRMEPIIVFMSHADEIIGFLSMFEICNPMRASGSWILFGCLQHIKTPPYNIPDYIKVQSLHSPPFEPCRRLCHAQCIVDGFLCSVCCSLENSVD